MNWLHRCSCLALGLAIALVPEIVSAGDNASVAQQPAQPAASTVTTEVLVLHGTNDNTGIDPKIGKIPALSKPPFSAYNSYKQLDRPSLKLETGKSGKVKLPNGTELILALKSIVQPQKAGDPVKYAYKASIQKPDGTAVLPGVDVTAKAGEMFFIAGQNYKGGILVFGIKVSP